MAEVEEGYPGSRSGSSASSDGLDDEDRDLLAIDFFGESRRSPIMPSISDQLQVGVATSDQHTQTRDDEILDIKHITEAVRAIGGEMGDAQRDLKFLEQVMMASFQDKIEAKAFQLQSRLMERMQNLNQVHARRVSMIRASFRQQLDNALVALQAQYKSHFNKRLAALKSSDSEATMMSDDMEQQIETLQRDLHTARAEIEERERDIVQLKEEMMKIDSEQNSLMSVYDAGTETEVDGLKEKLNDANAQAEKLLSDVVELRQTVEEKDEQIGKVMEELEGFKSKAAKEAKEAKKRKAEEAKAAKVAAKEAKANKSVSEIKEGGGKKGTSQVDISESNQSELDTLKKESETKIREAVASERELKQTEINKLKRELEHMRLQLNSCTIHNEEDKKDIARKAAQKEKAKWLNAQKRWESKFRVLRASLHAIKDEAYVRAQLQKQTVPVKCATVSYGVSGGDDPDGSSSSTHEGRSSEHTSPRASHSTPRLSQAHLTKQQIVDEIAEKERLAAFETNDQDSVGGDDDDSDVHFVALRDKSRS